MTRECHEDFRRLCGGAVRWTKGLPQVVAVQVSNVVEKKGANPVWTVSVNDGTIECGVKPLGPIAYEPDWEMSGFVGEQGEEEVREVREVKVIGCDGYIDLIGPQSPLLEAAVHACVDASHTIDPLKTAMRRVTIAIKRGPTGTDGIVSARFAVPGESKQRVVKAKFDASTIQ